MMRSLAGTSKEQPSMNTMTIRSLAVALAVIPVIGFSADSSNLNVRMGLWETTMTVAGAGDAAMAGMAEAMQNMTPEQKARMAAAMSHMRQEESVPRVHKSRSCMTPEKMHRDSFFNDKEMGKKCTHTIVENTPRATAVSFTCSENGVTNQGQVRFEATSPTSVKGTMDMHMVMHDKPVNMHSDFQSTWIGADCGTEK
jgi:hypothetical protein